jgi:hypothetical protein
MILITVLLLLLLLSLSLLLLLLSSSLKTVYLTTLLVSKLPSIAGWLMNIEQLME